ncbi:MAG TPA: hypothetical protein ACFYD8_13395 [Candidatus Wujingus californicus]|uniref:hypothetical protein n=1 Tax=Candidatus Wujingus californicus TaxID=3367618 RepID=UPI0040252594
MKNIFNFFKNHLNILLCLVFILLFTPTLRANEQATAAYNSSNYINTTPIIVVTSLGTLNLSKSTAYLSGDTIVATVVDVDRNVTVNDIDWLNTAIRVTGADYSVGGTDLLLDLKETGVNSGTFLATIHTAGGTTIQNTSATTANDNEGDLKTIQGGTANVIYTDTSPSNSSVTKQVTFSAYDATIEFDADAYGLNSYATIIMADAEQNTNIETAQTLLDSVFIQTSSSNAVKVRMTENSLDTGTFIGSILVATNGATTDYSQIVASEGQTLTTTYSDEINTTGSSRNISDTASVVLATPTPTETPTFVPTPTLQITETPTPTPTQTPIVDTSSPTGTININNGATYTNSTIVSLNLSAKDNVGVTGYYISTSASTPSLSDSGWTDIISTTIFNDTVLYTLSTGDGSKLLYAWYKDASGNLSSSSTDSITLDMTEPIVTITSPTTSSTYTTTSSIITLGGSASDTTSGISIVTWNNSAGGSGTASGTTSWNTGSIALSSGDNVITISAKDGAGNTGTDSIIVTYSIKPTISPTPTSIATATSTRTPTPTPTATATPTPIICDEATDIEAEPDLLILKVKKGDTVIVTVTGENGCQVEGDTVRASVSDSSLIRVSPRRQVTDENGEAVFTIKAKDKAGNAVVIFRDRSLSTQVAVRVVK